MEYIKLNTDIDMPMLGYGVFKIDQQECERCVSDALEVGYRMIDTAAAYGNEKAVGQAIAKSGIQRDELFITTKLKYNGFDSMTMDAFEKSLEELGLDYVDLYLIHQPYGNIFGAYDAIEKIMASGRIKSIGVSNFEAALLADIITNHQSIPSVNQIEINPYKQQVENVKFMKSEGVIPMAWGPISQGGQGGLFENPIILDLSKKYSKSPAQIVLRWHVQRGISAVVKSSNRLRMKENLNIFDFELSEDELLCIGTLDDKEQKDIHSDPEFVKMLCGKWNINKFR